MRKNFFAAVVVGGEVFTASEGVDVWIGRWNADGVDVYVMDETIRDTTPPSAHEYRNFEVSIKLVNNGQVEDIRTYMYHQLKENAWESRLIKRQNGPIPSHTDSYMVPAGNKIFEFCIMRLGWSYTIRNGHYY